MTTASAGKDKYLVNIAVHETGGNGLCAFLYGGELAHVGGVAMATPSPCAATGKLTSDISQLCAPGHKDVIAAAEAAKRLCAATAQTVTVTAGIHVDGASPEDIHILSENAKEAVDKWISQNTFLGG